MKRLPSTILLAVLLLFVLNPVSAGNGNAALPTREYTVNGPVIDPNLQKTLNQANPPDMLRVIITMKRQADLSGINGMTRAERLRSVVTALRNTAQSEQGPVQAFLKAKQGEGTVGRITPFWIFNGFSIEIAPAVVIALAARTDIASISADETFFAPVPEASVDVVEPNLELIQAPALWTLGYKGQGVVVASMDTGVYLYHPAYQSRWRGGANSWFDPNGEHPLIPTDMNGHGTQVMGVMVGDSTSGTAIGVAPQAQWIAVKIFNDQGLSTNTAIHAGFQWLLDPDGNPDTPDAPHVVNNSWGAASPGCSLDFDMDLQALRAAGILPIFSAGNAGPEALTSISPANNPGAFAVGAISNNNVIYTLSSRGPSSCGEVETIFPEMTAPGVEILSSNYYGSYSTATGTSLAAPHVSGALALLLSAHPDLTVDQQEAALINGAVDLGASGPDNDYGYGRLDVLAAFQSLPPVEPQASPTPTFTATPTQIPATPSPTPFTELNLALNSPVSTSSVLDSSHSGAQAVDGLAATYWQTMKPARKNPLPAEWITVDLGGTADLTRVILRWGSSYATQYTIQVLNNSGVWTTLHSQQNGDGGIDTIPLDGASGQYVRLYSTGWISSTVRIQLTEFEVYGYASAPIPTPTFTPTPTQISQVTSHIGDIDSLASLGNRGRWNASVMILVHDDLNHPVTDALVSGHWNSSAAGSSTCSTGPDGWCTISLSNIKDSVSSVTFTADNVSGPALLYQPAQNHDPDGDSNGTQILIIHP